MAERSKDDVAKHLEVAIPAIRMRRKPVEQDWLLYHACWRAQKTRFYYTDGQSDHYIPAARRQIEKFVTRCRKQLLPTQEFFEVYPWDQAAPNGSGAETVQAFLLYVLLKKMKLRSWVDQVIRSFQLYGRSVVENTIMIEASPLMTRSQDGRVLATMIPQVWPVSRVVDPFAFYTWPETANTLADMELLFEDAMVPYGQYTALREATKRGDEYVLEEIKPDELSRPEWPTTHQVRLQASGLTDPENTVSGGDKKPQGASFLALTKTWFRHEGRWWIAWLAWNVTNGPRVVRYHAAPYPEPNYRFAFSRQLPGEGYTTGQMSDLEPLNVWLNDEINMTQDAHLAGMFPPVLIDPMAIRKEDSLVYRPRAKWFVDPAGVKPMDGPDTTQRGLQSVGEVMGYLDSFGGSNPLAEGSPSRGMPRAGYAVSSLIQLAMADITAVAEQLEDEILSPTLSDLYRNAMLFIPQDQKMRIPAVMGLPQRDVSPDALWGDYTFRWVGSLQAQDMQVKSQKMITLLGVLAKAAPVIQANGKKIMWDLIAKRLWREGMGERGAESLIHDMTPEEMQQAIAMAGNGPKPEPVKKTISLSGKISEQLADELAIEDDPTMQAHAKQAATAAQGAQNGHGGGTGGEQPPGTGANPGSSADGMVSAGRSMTESAQNRGAGGVT